MKKLIRTIATALAFMLFLTSCGTGEASPKLHQSIAPLYDRTEGFDKAKVPEGTEIAEDLKQDH